MKFLDKLDKKYKYMLHAGLITTYAFFASVLFWNYSFYTRVGIGLILLTCSVVFVHYPNVKLSAHKLNNMLMVLVLPFCLFGGVSLALKYYPNLSIIFKTVLLFGTGLMFYIVAIVDNIFLVVRQREEAIPLYRAAIPWSQILTISIAIPLFAGVFKIPTYSYVQVSIIFLFSVILSYYQFWTHRHEENLVPMEQGGILLLTVLTGLFVFSIGIATSFLSTESFLRGISASAALMFGLFYTSAFLKNALSKKIIIQYLLIVFVFVFLSFLFE